MTNRTVDALALELFDAADPTQHQPRRSPTSSV
jgi:hypothetical protein